MPKPEGATDAPTMPGLALPPFELTADETAETALIAQGLCGSGRQVDDTAWVGAARAAWEELPGRLRRSLREFRRSPGTSGLMLVRHLPLGPTALPDTPSVSGAVQRGSSAPAAVMMMLAAGLGDPTAFQAEKSGALVQDVVPVPGQEDVQGNTGSVALMMHNENAFHQHRPDYVLLLCLRSDHDRVAGLRTACIREALPLLSEEVREVLSSPEFRTQPPPSFAAGDVVAPPHAVLTGERADPDVQVDFAATSGLTARAEKALTGLEACFDRISRTVRLEPGDLAVVDNRITLHGRTAFRPRYDGRDRWLQRVFVLNDLRRSRDHRPEDGYVMVR